MADLEQITHPLIFKTNASDAHKSKEAFSSGFGCTIADAIEASCSAYPLFEIKKLRLPSTGVDVALVDGGFVANNPGMIALTDALRARGVEEDKLRILSISTGGFPKKTAWRAILQGIPLFPSLTLIEVQLDASAELASSQLEFFGRRHGNIIRVHSTTTDIQLATNLLEHKNEILGQLCIKGAEAYKAVQADVERTSQRRMPSAE